MDRADEVRMRHMLDAAREALSFIQGRSRAELDENRMLVLSLVKEVEIVGEAAYKVSAATRESLPSIPWADVIGMRHRLIHAYFDINLDVLWQTLVEDLPELVSVIESALPPPVVE